MLRVSVKKTKIVIRSENAVQVSVEGQFPIAVCRECVGSNSILCQFCIRKRCTGSRGKLKEDSCCKFQTCANQQPDTPEDCPDINGLSLETVKKFYLRDTI